MILVPTNKTNKTIKKRNILEKLPEKITINLYCIEKVEISGHKLLVYNRIVATIEDDLILLDFATIAINSLLSCGFDVAFINHDTGEEKSILYEN